jgi:molecular chaperone GrpE
MNEKAKPNQTTGTDTGNRTAKEQRASDQGDGRQATTTTVSASELETLRKQASERDEFLDLARRTQAEFQNYQKRSARERDQERQYFASGFVRDLLPVLDNLERATAAAKTAGETGPLVQGVQMVLTQFRELLTKYGVTPIEAEGKPFDHNLHEALTEQPSKDHPPNTVIHVEERGYMIGDRVLRPAKVVVSSAPAQ